jgi:hypothetical protein
MGSPAVTRAAAGKGDDGVSLLEGVARNATKTSSRDIPEHWLTEQVQHPVARPNTGPNQRSVASVVSPLHNGKKEGTEEIG